MADEVTATKKVTPVKVEESEASKNAKTINDALDKAKEAMLASGISEGDADAFLNAARPSGVSTAVGNFADLQRSSGLPSVVADPPDEGRLKSAHKAPEETPAETKGF